MLRVMNFQLNLNSVEPCTDGPNWLLGACSQADIFEYSCIRRSRTWGSSPQRRIPNVAWRGLSLLFRELCILGVPQWILAFLYTTFAEIQAYWVYHSRFQLSCTPFLLKYKHIECTTAGFNSPVHLFYWNTSILGVPQQLFTFLYTFLIKLALVPT